MELLDSLGLRSHRVTSAPRAASLAKRQKAVGAVANSFALPLNHALALRRPTRHVLGQSTAEFALVLPLLMLVVIGFFWLSQLLEAYDFVAYAAEAAARYAIVRGATSPQPVTANDISTMVAEMAVGLNPKQLTVTTTWIPNNQPGSTVEVQVQYAFQLPLPYMPTNTFSLSSTSEMVIAQ